MTRQSLTQNESPVPVGPAAYDEVAARMQEALDTIASLIPTVALTLEDTVSYVRQRLGISLAEISEAATAAENSPQLASLMDVADARDMLAMNAALRPVFDRIDRVGASLKFVLDARRVRCGAEAMNVYAAAKRLAAGKGGFQASVHVENIKAVMPKGKGRRRKPAPETATPAPTPEPPDHSNL
jgi:hypothetical protein